MNFNKTLSIKKLTLIIFVIMYIIFFILTTMNLYSYSSHEFRKTEKLIKNYNVSLSQQIIEKLNNVSDVSKYPLLIPEIDNLHNILIKDSYFNITEYNYLRYLCEMMLIQNESINGAFIYDVHGRGVFTTRNTSNDQLKNPASEDWFIKTLESENQVSFIPNINSTNLFQYTQSEDEQLLAVTRKIIDIKTQKLTGILIITLPMKEISDLLIKDLPFKDQVLSIYDSSGNLILSSGNSDFTDFHKKTNDYNYIPSIDYVYKEVPCVISYNTISTVGWSLVNSIPKSEAYHISSLYVVSFVINILFFAILFLILYFLFLKRIFNPVESLINNMGKNIESSLNYDFNYDREDEIGVLIKSYNEMKSRINDLININYKNQIEQKELELRQLQNQINPHFIYNTLESIHMMAEINDDLETSTMAEYFGSIIRYSMNRKINTVSLKEEISIIENYIYLQRIRFDQIFTIENIINPDVLNCEIIKMIIQPLIENSIYHGLSECSGDGKIIIQGEQLNDNLVLTISDNGVGIEDKKLAELNAYINDKNNNFKGIALRNINRRLKLNYGEEFGLQIFSVHGNGTSMQLTLPYIEME